MTKSSTESPNHFDTLVQTVHRLRAPGGCPWDRAQTHQSLRPYLIEEAYEVLEAIDHLPGQGSDPDSVHKSKPQINAFCEELGDLLMQVLIHSEIAKEAGLFSIQDVIQGLNDKLIRRHPHVFGDTQAKDADAALANWEKQKAKERETQSKKSVLDGLPKGLPSLQRTERMIEKVTKVGFQWKNLEGPLDKLDEELSELKSEISKPNKNQTAVEAELGDLLFSVCNVASFLKVHPEDALRGTLSRFESRFRHVERRLQEQGKQPEHSTLEEMDLLWEEAKSNETKKSGLP